MTFDTEVVIVGGGPIGLVAAMDLDRRGIASILVEKRPYLEGPSVKCNHVSARTMERFRQLGIADRVRRAGLPVDHPHDVAFRTTMVGPEFARIPIPASAARFTSTVGPDTSWATPEPPHRINQIYLEPILMEVAAGLPHVDMRTETLFVGYDQDEEGVTVHIISPGGVATSLRARYLIGAEGGRSSIRKSIGARFIGDPVLQQVQSTCIRSPRLNDALPGDRAWCYYVLNPRRSGHVYAIDGRGMFLVHNYLTAAEAESATVDRHDAIRSIIGDDLDYEVVSYEDWTARRLVADSFRDRRVFIAGDSAHLWVPYAGYGMNAGIADVLNLTWLLGAVLSGWAHPDMLSAYEAERRPITEQVSHYVMSHQRKIAQDQVPAEIEDIGAAGDSARAQLGRDAYDLNVQQFAAEGLNFGYSYATSPIIAYDDGVAPPYAMGSYIPSTVPGCRAPHFTLSDGRSVYDALGDGYSLIRRDGSAAGDGVVEALRAAGAPVTVIDVPAARLPAQYEAPLVLLRDDQHIVWRGEESPRDVGSLVARLTGRSMDPPPIAPDDQATEMVDDLVA